jgi:signal peptidase II
MHGNKKIAYLAAFTGLIFIDQISKYLIRHLGGFYICNKDIAWGIKMPGVAFWIAWILIISFLFLAFLNKKPPHFRSFFTILILAGAVSNAVDRFYFGCVTDFIDLIFWPSFNLADIYITTGSLTLLAKYLKI